VKVDEPHAPMWFVVLATECDLSPRARNYSSAGDGETRLNLSARRCNRLARTARHKFAAAMSRIRQRARRQAEQLAKSYLNSIEMGEVVQECMAPRLAAANVTLRHNQSPRGRMARPGRLEPDAFCGRERGEAESEHGRRALCVAKESLSVYITESRSTCKGNS